MPGVSQKIEEFAHDKLHSVIDDVPAIEDMDTDESTSGLQEVCLKRILTFSLFLTFN